MNIYCTAVEGGIREGDYIAMALAADGQGLAQHLSSSLAFAKHDIGLTSGWKHDIYKKAYPDGYTLVWIDEKDLDAHLGWQEATRLNQELAKKAA